MRSIGQSFLRHPLSWMLGTTANVSVLRQLVLHGGELSLPMLVSWTGLAQSTVRQSLISLTEAKIVKELGGQRGRLYRIEGDHPTAESLIALFKTEGRWLDTVVGGLTSVAFGMPGLRAMWLYGSTARRQDEPGSDIDIALITDSNARAGVADSVRDHLQDGEWRLKVTFSIVTIDLDDVRRLATTNDPWWQEVTRDAVHIYGCRPNQILELVSKDADGVAG